MSSCLFYHTLSCIYQDNDQVSIGSTRDHIPCVLHMARCISDDELSFWRSEITIRYINGDTLFSLRTESVSKQGQVNRTICSVLR